MVLLFFIYCLLLLSLFVEVYGYGPCFVVKYFVHFLVLQSSRWKFRYGMQIRKYSRSYSGSEFVVANTLAKRKKLEPNEINFNRSSINKLFCIKLFAR